jgi:predicted Zn finger-like uncharacterized protein
MYTVCPKCTLALAVTAPDLRAGQGYVRCGRCANVFNALLALQDETETSPGLPIGPLIVPGPGADATPEPAPIAALPDFDVTMTGAPRLEPEAALVPAPEPTAAATPEPATLPAPDWALAPLRGEQAPAGRMPEEDLLPEEGEEAFEAFTEILPEDLAARPMEQPRQVADADADAQAEAAAEAAAADDATEVDEFRGTGTYETIVLEGDGFLQTEELLPDATIDAEIAAVSRQLAAAHAQASADLPPTAVRAPATARESRPMRNRMPLPNVENESDPNADADAEAMAAAIADAVAQLGPATEPPRRARWQVPAAVLGVLLLCGQMLHHWRNQLATQPALTGLITRLYAGLGQTLTPEWDLAAYDVRQLGASADSQDNRAIHVRLSLASRAHVPQGLPLVRLTLIDRYGKPLSAGELGPAQYLPPAQRGLRLLAPDQRIDTDVSVLDASQQASSFELDICLPRAGGGLRCAADAALAGSHS